MDTLDLNQSVDPEAIARQLAPWLDDLEARIDPADELRLEDAWRAFADGRCPDAVFRPRRSQPRPSSREWPSLSIDQALRDPASMVLHQLQGVHGVLAGGGGALLCVRANYGTGILPSLFGCPVVLMDPAMHTLPGTLPLGRPAIPGLVAAGVPPLDRGAWPLVRAVGAAFVACARNRPGLRRHLHIYHPDLQGPMDALEMVWGSACFTDFVDHEELVHAFLGIITEAYARAMADWDAVVPTLVPGYAAHWGMLHRGHIMLRDDSAMNLSPRMFDRYIAPYDRALLERCGGGAIHACGKVDHFLERATSLPCMHGFNFGQPHLNAPQRIVAGTIARQVPILGISQQDWAALGAEGRGLVHCW